MKQKKWLKIWFIIILILPVIGLFNFFMDPLWLYNHSHSFNNMQKAVDERKVKTIYLNNHINKYDSLLLGSSRATYYNQHDFTDMKLFNYSVSSAKPYEYIDFIDNFKAKNSLKNIVIAVDFFQSHIRKAEDSEAIIKQNKELIRQLNQTNKHIYAIRNYLTLDALRFSIKNFKRAIRSKTGHRSYNRNNIVLTDNVPIDKVKSTAESRAESYYNDSLSYDPSFLTSLKQIKKQNPKVNIYIYTTPLPRPFLQHIYNSDRLTKYYISWLKDLASLSDKIYFTSYMNRLATDYSSYSIDGDHYYPHINKEIARFISGGKLSSQHINIADNIIILSSDNIDKVLASILPQ